MIRLITVIGHGLNLLPHFIRHYFSHVRVEEINIITYNTPEHPHFGDDVANIVDKYSGNNIKIIKNVFNRSFDWNKVTELYNEVKNSHPDDWWVIADIDEFHLYPEKIYDILIESNNNGWDIIRGGFIDRLGKRGEFPLINNNHTVWEQFPNAGFFRYPMSGACPNKICVSKGYVELTSGQHYAKINGHTTWGWQGWSHPLINPKHTVQVHHFKWDITVFDRLKAITKLDKKYAYSNEYDKIYKELKKCGYVVDLANKDFLFEENQTEPNYYSYKQWNKLINKIKTL